MFITPCVCEWVTAVYIDTVELPFITNVHFYLPMSCYTELWRHMLIALRIIQLPKERIEIACSGTMQMCLSTRPGKEQRSNFKRGKVIQKAAKCVTSLPCAALCCWNQQTARLACFFFILLSHSEPFYSHVSEFLNQQQSYLASWTEGFCFDPHPQPQHLLCLVKCCVVFPPETLCDHTLKLAMIYYFIFPLHDPLLRYRAEDMYKILLRQSDF